MLRFLLVCLFVVMSGFSAASAAEMRLETVSESGQEVNFILVAGEFVDGDEDRFAEIALSVDSAIVIFSSPGGKLLTGIEIGTIVRLKGFMTAVAADETCASACALAWLAGFPRFMGSDRSVGFHAAWKEDGAVSSGGNALVGAYLNRMGFSDLFIVYATAERPDRMEWLTFEEASNFGVPVLRLGEESVADGSSGNGSGASVPKRERQIPVAAPEGGDSHWIQLYSRSTFAEATMLAAEATTKVADPISVFEYRNGWFVVVLGPYTESDARLRLSELAAVDALPQDSAVSDGRGHVELVWHDDGQGRSTWAGRGACHRFRGLAAAALVASECVRACSHRPMLAPTMSYFGSPMPREAVMEEKRKFAERWPQRDYFLDPNGVTAICEAGGMCIVEGIVAWRAHSPDRGATSSGLARVRYELTAGSPPLIVSEESEVTQRDGPGQPAAIAAGEERVIETFYVANTEPDRTLNLRQSPGTDAAVLVEIPKGTRGIAVGYTRRSRGSAPSGVRSPGRERLAGHRPVACLVRRPAEGQMSFGRDLDISFPHYRRTMTTSRYSLGTTIVVSPETLNLPTSAMRSAASACLPAVSSPANAFSIGP